jgi:rhodanese-related sulfurtransferase
MTMRARTWLLSLSMMRGRCHSFACLPETLLTNIRKIQYKQVVILRRCAGIAGRRLMIFGIGKTRKHHEIGASSLHGMIAANQVWSLMREVDEFAAGHIPGAINMPLSTFQASQLPHPGKVVVLNCQGGKRSGMALDAARQARRSTRIWRRLWRLAGRRSAGRTLKTGRPEGGNDAQGDADRDGGAAAGSLRIAAGAAPAGTWQVAGPRGWRPLRRLIGKASPPSDHTGSGAGDGADPRCAHQPVGARRR